MPDSWNLAYFVKEIYYNRKKGHALAPEIHKLIEVPRHHNMVWH